MSKTYRKGHVFEKEECHVVVTVELHIEEKGHQKTFKQQPQLLPPERRALRTSNSKAIYLTSPLVFKLLYRPDSIIGKEL